MWGGRKTFEGVDLQTLQCTGQRKQRGERKVGCFGKVNYGHVQSDRARELWIQDHVRVQTVGRKFEEEIRIRDRVVVRLHCSLRNRKKS